MLPEPTLPGHRAWIHPRDAHPSGLSPIPSLSQPPGQVFGSRDGLRFPREGGGLLTPRARSCGCASCIKHLPAAAAAPPAREPAVGAGGFLSCRCHEGGTAPRTTPRSPFSPPRARPSILGMVLRAPRHKGCAKHQIKPSPSSSCAGAFPIVAVSQGTQVPSLAMPTPCPGGWQPWHQVCRHFCFRGERSCSAGPSRGLQQGRKPLFGVQLTPCHPPRGCPQPQAFGGPTVAVTSLPPGLW